MKQFAASMLCFFIVSTTKAEPNPQCGINNINQYLDDILEKVRTNIGDPIALPNATHVVKLTSGKYFGLNTINRTGDATVSCTEDDLTVTFPFETAKPIRARFDWEYKSLFTTWKGLIYARADSFGAIATVRAPRDGSSPPKITDLDVKSIGDSEINFTGGISHVSWLVSRMLSTMSNVFKRVTATVAKTWVTTVMNEQLKVLNLTSY